MRDLSTLTHHPIADQLVKILCQKTQNSEPLFFRVMVAYYFSKVASMMRCNIQTMDRGVIPINMYAVNLATSGHGKGHSTNIIEEQVIGAFKSRFLDETFPGIADINLYNLACARATKRAEDPDDIHEQVKKEFRNLGPLVFGFDSGTTAAVKQMRHKLLMAGAGSMNLEIDEIGSNLLGNTDVLTTFLELFDIGRIKQKLIKNTAENLRSEEIDGRTPTNLMCYGTPSKLFDAGKVENEFISFLDTGYGRRCLFGYARTNRKLVDLTPDQILDLMTNTQSDLFLDQMSDKFFNLADRLHFDKKLYVSRDVTLAYIEYKTACEKLASELPEHDEIRKAELTHRYFKALKLAGAYAFVDESFEITEDHLYNAICLVEESGVAFSEMMSRDRPYVKLCKYIGSVNSELTQADLVEDLPFYRGGVSQKSELMQLAIAHGYKNNILIKRRFVNGIEFIRGESLQETSLDKIIFSYSNDIAQRYKPVEQSFQNMVDKLVIAPNMHFCNHHFSEEHRLETNALPNFNLLILDVDGTFPLVAAQKIFADYTYCIYTTKRHKENGTGPDRYRIMIPLNYTLKLDAEDYKECMQSIFESLPFEVDSATGQRSRKWLTNHNAKVFSNTGKMFDVLPYIPKTAKNEERKAQFDEQTNFAALERWFVNNTGVGNRSNQLIKYALLLVDTGKTIPEIQSMVEAFNEKLPDKLTLQELHSTILATAYKAVGKRDAGV